MFCYYGDKDGNYYYHFYNLYLILLYVQSPKQIIQENGRLSSCSEHNMTATQHLMADLHDHLGHQTT